VIELRGGGALIGCIVGNGASSCANCDWNRSGAACSFTNSPRKRKHAKSDDEDDDDSGSDILEGIDRKTCLKIAAIFRKATDKKKKKHT
jgi:hypothetical protein